MDVHWHWLHGGFLNGQPAPKVGQGQGLIYPIGMKTHVKPHENGWVALASQQLLNGHQFFVDSYEPYTFLTEV